MKDFTRITLLPALVVLVSVLAAPTHAQDFDKGKAAYVANDYDGALRELQPLADSGHPGAQFLFGQMYYWGRGVPESRPDAAIWLRRAAEQGHPEAQVRLSLIYECGQGVRKDEAKAVEWIRRAAKQGHIQAQMFLGYRYKHGDGVPKNANEAVKWYRRAADRGGKEEQYRLGELLYESYRFYNDSQSQARAREAEAIKWITRAADQGHPDAMFKLSNYYSLPPDGPNANLVESYKWMMIAITYSDWYSKKNLDVRTRNMTLAQIAEAQRLAGEWLKAHRKKSD